MDTMVPTRHVVDSLACHRLCSHDRLYRRQLRTPSSILRLPPPATGADHRPRILARELPIQLHPVPPWHVPVSRLAAYRHVPPRSGALRQTR